MKDKINVAELLKDCPSGMELDCTMYDDVFFYEITDDPLFPICIKRIDGAPITLTKYGEYANCPSSKCVIFPKGKTTWEGFKRPFMDGDIVTWKYKGSLVACIYKERKDNVSFNQHIALYKGSLGVLVHERIALTDDELRFATEEEKAKLFKAIKYKGYKWNPDNKTLEKLPKFKVGDRIILKDNPHNIPSIKIKAVTKSQYILENEGFFYISSADEKYVLEDKFDITTLKPFESRVLVRTKHFHDNWTAGFFSHKDSDGFAPFWTTADKNYQQCIPFEGNEHLLGTTDDCDKYFKTWK